MLSAAKHLVLRPFASLRVTHKCANLVWFDLVLISNSEHLSTWQNITFRFGCRVPLLACPAVLYSRKVIS
jgi:hypothetical protein